MRAAGVALISSKEKHWGLSQLKRDELLTEKVQAPSRDSGLSIFFSSSLFPLQLARPIVFLFSYTRTPAATPLFVPKHLDPSRSVFGDATVYQPGPSQTV